MKSPHGKPSPVLLRSIHWPYLRHNAGETVGDLTTKRRKPAAPAFPSSAAAKALIAGTGAPHHALVIRLLDLTNI
jgi:hypothetical protein